MDYIGIDLHKNSSQVYILTEDGVTVIEFTRTVMVYRRGHTPEAFRPRPSP